jgi:flagellar motor protein MotB
MNIRGWALPVIGLVLLQAGCVVDAIVRDKDREIGILQDEVNSQRRRVNDLTASLTAASTKGDMNAMDEALAMQKQLESLGIKVTAKGPILVVTLANSILFDPGKTAFKPGATRALDEIARILSDKFKNSYIRVEGHTDNVPINKTKNLYASNWDLSAARALVVLRYLVSKGVSPDKIYAAAFGEFQPTDSNATELGRSHNRRVEIVILPPLAVEKERMR